MRKLKNLLILFLILVTISSSSVYSSLSVIYRTNFPTYQLVDPTESCGKLSCTGGENDHIRSSVGSSISGFPVTLQYNNKIDFISWRVINPNKVPQNTVLYIYIFISQIAIASGSKAVLCGFGRHSAMEFGGIFLVMSETQLWTAFNERLYEASIEDFIYGLESKPSRQSPVSFDKSSDLVVVLKIKYIDLKHIYVYNMTVIQNNQVILDDQINSYYNISDHPSYYNCRFVVVVVGKYQVTVEDMFVSYDAPNVLLGSGGTGSGGGTGGDVPQEPPPGGGQTPGFIYPPPPDILINVTAPPTWLYILFDLVKQGRMVEATYYLYSWALGGYMFFIALLVVLGSFSCYLRGGLTAVSVFLLLTGALLYILLPPEIHTMAQIIIILGIAILLYKVVTNE